MAINIMEQYIDLTKKQIRSYMKLVFVNKYNKGYVDEYINKYINIRYYNYFEDGASKTLRKKILSVIKDVTEDLTIDNIEDRELFENMRVFFYYMVYFDNVVYYKDLKEKVISVNKLRIKRLNKKDENFVENLYSEMYKYDTLKNDLIKRFETEDFYLKITNYPDKLNIYRVNLKYNMKLPEVYSEFALNKAFEMGLVNEDKLFVEYYMTVAKIIKDVKKLNFKRQYIVEFADTLLEKPRKLKSLLTIIDNLSIHDKITLKIRYEKFIKYKDLIYDMMREGINFAIILDNSFKVNFKNIEGLKIFKYIILNKNTEYYEDFKSHKDMKIVKKVIEI